MINTVLDQASGLRKMNQNNNSGVKVIAVTGGKGGVGKTNVSLNTAIALGHGKSCISIRCRFRVGKL